LSANEFACHLPKGPRGKWGPTLKIIKDPRRAFEGWIQKYGDPFLVHALNGPIVVTGRADLIKQIFGGDPDMFSPFATQTIGPTIGFGSMLVLEGNDHKRERRLMMPMFHGDRMRAYATTMQEVALEQMQPNQSLESFLTLDMMTSISLEVIVKAIFGSRDRTRGMRMFAAGREVVKRASPLLFFTTRTHVSFFGLSPWDRYSKAKAELVDAIDIELDDRKRLGGTGDDILSLLANATYDDGSPITRQHIRDELQTFLFAGHETSALAMTWAMYHLHKHPETLSRLRQELKNVPDDDAEQLAQLPYLKAVVQETLRLNPIVTEVIRVLKHPLTLDAYQIPVGYGVASAAAIAHYNAETYPEPNRFRPERFLERSFSPFEYMPFGGGSRRCIGASFAGFEMAIILGTLLKRFQFQLLESAPVVPVRRNVTLGPSTGVRMKWLGNVDQGIG
jgi:cytochrome P450